MKATGIQRRVDELGRIVLPVELRRALEIEDRDLMEISWTNMTVSFSSRTATAASSAAARRTSAPSAIKTSAANVSVSCTEDEQKQKMRKERPNGPLSACR